MTRYRIGDYVYFQWSKYELTPKVRKFGYIVETFGKGSDHVEIREIVAGIKGNIYDVPITDILSKPKRKP